MTISFNYFKYTSLHVVLHCLTEHAIDRQSILEQKYVKTRVLFLFSAGIYLSTCFTK